MIVNPMVYSGKKLPELDNPGAAADLLAGKQLVDQYGNPLTGTMPQKSAGDLSASGATVMVPAGYYPNQVSKKVAEAVQATPGISVSSNGLITASVTQGEGYVAAGTKSATQQLTTQAGKTVTPGTSLQTAVASGRYTTGPVYVAGDANLVAGNIKSGVSIFGVAGTAQTKSPATCVIGSRGSSITVYGPNIQDTLPINDPRVYTFEVGTLLAIQCASGAATNGSNFSIIKTVFDSSNYGIKIMLITIVGDASITLQ